MAALVPVEKYGKTPNFSGKQHFYSYFQNPSENSAKKLMFNQLNFIKYIKFNTKVDAISAHGSKVLNEEWITKKLVLNWLNFTRNIKFKKRLW